MSTMAALPRVVRWVVLASAVVWVASELRQSLTHRAEGVKAGWGGEVGFRIMVAGGAATAGIASGLVPAARIRPVVVAGSIGLALFWAGILLRLWSFRTLGRYFTFVVQTSRDQPVITDGPYRFVRHPSYTGLLLAVMAVGLFIGNWLAFACLAVAIGGALVYRIRVEERALVQNLGDDYRRYAATHKRLVPFVW